jgi:hypothetical protein
VESDHKPLEAILRKPLSSAPRRLQGMMLRIQGYDITVQYERGKDMHLADTLLTTRVSLIWSTWLVSYPSGMGDFGV